eukprot:6208978-Pleurochrysis_carterae.AAC.1
MAEIKESLQNRRPGDRLTALQEAITRAAAEVVGEKGRHSKEKREREAEYNRREEQELKKEEQKRERQRHQLFMWNRHLYHAHRYTGGRGNDGGFWRRRDIRQDCILNKIAGDNRKARRRRVIEMRRTANKGGRAAEGNKEGDSQVQPYRHEGGGKRGKCATWGRRGIPGGRQEQTDHSQTRDQRRGTQDSHEDQQSRHTGRGNGERGLEVVRPGGNRADEGRQNGRDEENINNKEW